jgi:hypothetical protein
MCSAPYAGTADGDIDAEAKDSNVGTSGEAIDGMQGRLATPIVIAPRLSAEAVSSASGETLTSAGSMHPQMPLNQAPMSSQAAQLLEFRPMHRGRTTSPSQVLQHPHQVWSGVATTDSFTSLSSLPHKHPIDHDLFGIMRPSDVHLSSSPLSSTALTSSSPSSTALSTPRFMSLSRTPAETVANQPMAAHAALAAKAQAAEEAERTERLVRMVKRLRSATDAADPAAMHYDLLMLQVSLT